MKAIDNEELRKLIAENPDLPLVFYVCNDEVNYDYGITVFEGCTCSVDTIYIDDDRSYDDIEDIVEEYRDFLCYEEKYKDLSDDEFDKAVEEYINENVRHYKAIIIKL